MRKNTINIFTLLVLIGCAGSSMTTSKYRSRVFTASYENTFESTVDYFQERGFQINKANLSSGDIETDYREGAGWATRSMTNRRAKVTGKVIQVSDQETKLTLTIISEERSQMSGWFQVEMDVRKEQFYYKRYFESIENRIKSKGR